MTPVGLKRRILETVRHYGEATVTRHVAEECYVGRGRPLYDLRSFAVDNQLEAAIDALGRFYFRLSVLELPMPAADPLDRDARRMLDQALAGEMPREILADWLEERGDRRAQAVRGLEVDWLACAQLLKEIGHYSPATVEEYARRLEDICHSRKRPLAVEKLVLTQAKINLRATLAWLFRPLLDSHDKDTALRLHGRDLGSVEELAAASIDGERGPEICYDGGSVEPPEGSAMRPWRCSPPVGRVRRLWAIGGRLYGELRFRPLVDARGPTGVSVEVMRALEPERPFVRAVLLRTDPAEMADQLLKFMGDVRPPGQKPPKGTGQLFNSL